VPRYFFHTQDGVTVPDESGVELADVQEARLEAASLVGQMLRDDRAEFWRSEALSLSVTDPDGLTLFTILVSAVVSPAVNSLRNR
jgi:hypothetical protein